MPHASTLRRCADLAGRAPLRQISNHAAAHNLIAVQEPLLGAAPDNLRHPPGLLGLIHAARTPVAGNFTTHHRRATPNRAADTHLGQASLHPHHNRSAILNTEHPTTAHNHPLQQHCYHTNSLHPMTLPTGLPSQVIRQPFSNNVAPKRIGDVGSPIDMVFHPRR